MAANMKAVKLRIKSVQSTMQITKAMELVASSKLRKAKSGQKSAVLTIKISIVLCSISLWIIQNSILCLPGNL